jgi:hypothetical protein
MHLNIVICLAVMVGFICKWVYMYTGVQYSQTDKVWDVVSLRRDALTIQVGGRRGHNLLSAIMSKRCKPPGRTCYSILLLGVSHIFNFDKIGVLVH